jgi:hypothetical protein
MPQFWLEHLFDTRLFSQSVDNFFGDAALTRRCPDAAEPGSQRPLMPMSVRLRD